MASETPPEAPLMDDLAFSDEPVDPNSGDFDDSYEGEIDGQAVRSVDGSEAGGK